ncbi:hypothetical protein FRC10_010909 [Ceratobasidium sp. 414]|nr:hypothetical protein FRC10_010909 [Ceratobasidium sp. 414]
MPVCPHCGKLRAQSTIDKHLRLQPRAVSDESDDSTTEDLGEVGDESGSFEVTGEIIDESMILHNISVQMADLSVSSDLEDMAGFIARTDSDVHSNTGALASINEPLDMLTPGPTLWRNPPVTVEEWPDPDAGGSEVSDVDDEPLDSLDRDPEYTEPTDPLPDEPDLTEEEFRERIEEELGFIDDEEWSNLCKSRTETQTF